MLLHHHVTLSVFMSCCESKSVCVFALWLLARHGDVLDTARRPLRAHPYLAQQLQDERGAVGVSIIIKVVHNLVVLGHELLVLLVIAAAELLVHYAELQLPERPEGRLEVQTLRV